MADNGCHFCFISLEGADIVTVLVGEEQREFTIHRNLLSDSCAFFQGHIEAIPPPSHQQQNDDEDEDSILWLPNEAPDMFEIFVLWLYQRRRFPAFIESTTQAMCPDKLRTLRTNLVRLHLFAAMIELPAVQDAAMDALQDMYLRLDWDMSPHFLAFLYGECDAQHSVRLRKWAVAMLAWSLHGVDKVAARHDADKLFVAYPDLKADYHMHLQKMAQSRADVRIKNPQLRLPANGLRSGERLFGFRQCTFHSHRAAVGEGTCPHALALGQTPFPLPVPGPDKEEVESDKEETDIISPVRDLNEVSYLDLS